MTLRQLRPLTTRRTLLLPLKKLRRKKQSRRKPPMIMFIRIGDVVKVSTSKRS